MRATKKQRAMRRILAWVMTFVMVFGLIPAEGLGMRTVHAEENEDIWQMVEGLGELNNGDICVLMAKTDAGKWYALTHDGASQVIYEDGKIQMGSDSEGFLAYMTVSDLSIIDGALGTYGSAKFQCGDFTLTSSEMKLAFRGNMATEFGADSKGVYLGSIYEDTDGNDQPCLKSIPYVLYRSTDYEENVEYGFGDPVDEDWCNPVGYLYKLVSEEEEASYDIVTSVGELQVGDVCTFMASDGMYNYVLIDKPDYNDPGVAPAFFMDGVIETLGPVEGKVAELTVHSIRQESDGYYYVVFVCNRTNADNVTSAFKLVASEGLSWREYDLSSTVKPWEGLPISADDTGAFPAVLFYAEDEVTIVPTPYFSDHEEGSDMGYSFKSPYSISDAVNQPIVYLYKKQTSTAPVIVAPETPTNFKAEANGDLGVDLTWDASEGADSYTIYRDGAVLDSSNQTSYEDENLEVNQEYSYQVVANNRAGSSSKSEAVKVKAALNVPPMPQNLTAKPGLRGTLEVKLNWDDPDPLRQTTGYHVYRDGVRITEEPISATSYIDTAERPSQSLRYAVTAVNAGGESEKTMEVSVNAPSVLPPSDAVALTLTLPNAGFAKAFLAKNGSVQLRGERSYSQPIVQDGDLGIYQFENVLEDTYEFVIVIGGKTVYSLKNAITVVNGETNAMTVDLSAVSDGFHGMVRIKQPGITLSYNLQSGSGWSVDDEGFMVDTNGDTAFWWNETKTFVSTTKSVYVSEKNKTYELLSRFSVDLSQTGADLIYALPVGNEIDITIVHFVFTAAGVSDFYNLKLTASVYQDGRYCGTNTLTLDAKGKADLILPGSANYEVALIIPSTTRDGVTIPDYMTQKYAVKNGDTVTKDLLDDGMATIALDFSASIPDLPSDISLKNIRFVLSDANHAGNGTIYGYLDANGRASAKIRYKDDANYVVKIYAQKLSDFHRVATATYYAVGNQVSGKLTFETIAPNEYDVSFKMQSVSSLEGLIVHMTCDGQSWDEELKDADGDGIADQSIQFSGYHASWSVDQQEIDGFILDEAAGMLRQGKETISLKTYKTLDLKLPGNGWKFIVSVYDTTDGKEKFLNNYYTSSDMLTVSYSLTGTAGDYEGTPQLTILLQPVSDGIAIKSSYWDTLESVSSSLVKCFNPVGMETVDFSDAILNVGFQTSLTVRDLDGDNVSEYFVVALFDGQSYLGWQTVSDYGSNGYVNFGADVKRFLMPKEGAIDKELAEKYRNDPVFSKELAFEEQDQTIYLPYQMLYRICIGNEVGESLTDQGLNTIRMRGFDETLSPIYLTNDENYTRAVLENPILVKGGKFTLYTVAISLDGEVLDKAIADSYTYWTSESSAWHTELDVFQASGVLDIALKDIVIRIHRNDGVATELKSISSLGNDILLVRLAQIPWLYGESGVKLPEGAYEILLNQATPVMQDGMIILEAGRSRRELSFKIRRTDLDQNHTVISYVYNQSKYHELRHYQIPYETFSYSLRNEMSSAEIVFDEPDASALKKGETAHVTSIYGLEVVNGRYWDPDPIIDNGKVYDTHYENMEEYREHMGYRREGSWLSFHSYQEDFEIALNVDGIPVEYSTSITPLLSPASLGMGGIGGSVSGGTGDSGNIQLSTRGGYHFFDLKEKQYNISQKWEEAASSDDVARVWVNKDWLEAYGFYSQEEGLGFLFIPMSEPKSYPHDYEIDLAFRYVDDAGETQTILEQDYITVYKDAPVLEKWSFTAEMGDKELVQSPAYYHSIRSRSDRVEYENSRDDICTLYLTNWFGTIVYTFRARFDDPDMVENVFAVGDVPEDCENYAIRMERMEEDQDGYNYIGVGLLGDAYNLPEDFSVVYSLKVANEYKNMPTIEVSSLFEEDSDIEVPEGWSYEVVAPVNGWTLEQTNAAWDLYYADVADGMLNDSTPYEDANHRLYWPAIKLYDETGELYAVYDNYLDFSDEEAAEDGYALAVMDQGEYKATLRINPEYDLENTIITRTVTCTDAGYLLPIPKESSALPPTPMPPEGNSSTTTNVVVTTYRKLPVPMPTKLINVIKTVPGKATKYVNTAEYMSERYHVADMLGAAMDGYDNNIKYGDAWSTTIEQSELMNMLPEDVRADYYKYTYDTAAQNVLVDAIGCVPGIGFGGKAALFGMNHLVFGTMRDKIEANYRRIAKLNMEEAERAARIEEFLNNERRLHPDDWEDYIKATYGEEFGTYLLGIRPAYYIDPSGYVYEGTENQLLEGVTATVYQYKGSTAGWIFDENGILTSGIPDGNKWVAWNSESYGEGPNPNVTDAQGMYGWNVLIGAWKVVFEKDGYITAESAVMNVPPAHTDVNISMVSLSNAEVTSVTANEEYIEIMFDKPVLVDDVETLVEIVLDEDGSILSGTFTTVDAAPLGIGNKQASGSEDVQALIKTVGSEAKAASVFRYVVSGLTIGQGITLQQVVGVRSYNGIVAKIDFMKATVQKKTDPITDIEYVGSASGLKANETRDLAAGLTIQGTEGTLIWTSMTPELATISNAGVITAKETDSGGKAIVKVVIEGSNVSTIIVIPVIGKETPLPAATAWDNVPKGSEGQQGYGSSGQGTGNGQGSSSGQTSTGQESNSGQISTGQGNSSGQNSTGQGKQEDINPTGETKVDEEEKPSEGGNQEDKKPAEDGTPEEGTKLSEEVQKSEEGQPSEDMTVVVIKPDTEDEEARSALPLIIAIVLAILILGASGFAAWHFKKKKK